MTEANAATNNKSTEIQPREQQQLLTFVSWRIPWGYSSFCLRYLQNLVSSLCFWAFWQGRFEGIPAASQSAPYLLLRSRNGNQLEKHEQINSHDNAPGFFIATLRRLACFFFSRRRASRISFCCCLPNLRCSRSWRARSRNSRRFLFTTMCSRTY